MTASIISLLFDDVGKLEDLLRENQLPTQDCVDQVQHFYGYYIDHELLAAGGLEPAGQYVLLRSVVVHGNFRSQGLGGEMTEFLLRKAASLGYTALYLLTESAEAYFRQFGFIEVERDQVPTEIASTQQFSTLCPDSACCMFLNLSSTEIGDPVST